MGVGGKGGSASPGPTAQRPGRPSTRHSHPPPTAAQLRRHEEALADAQECITKAPGWPKGYLRAARALVSLERHAEAVQARDLRLSSPPPRRVPPPLVSPHPVSMQALQAALRLAPRAEVLVEAMEEARPPRPDLAPRPPSSAPRSPRQARYLLRCQQRDQRALAGTGGDTDIIGIRRGCCLAKVSRDGVRVACDCPGYVQKHASIKVILDGRPVRNENNPEMLLCLRCGHEAYRHATLPDPARSNRGGRAGGAAPPPAAPASYTPSGARGGLDSGYYYAAVPREGQRAAPAAPAPPPPPPRAEFPPDVI